MYMSEAELSRCYSPREVGERLGVKAAKVISWIVNGELAAINVAANPKGKRARWRISPEALQAFENRRSSKPAQAAPVARRRTYRPNPDDIVFFK